MADNIIQFPGGTVAREQFEPVQQEQVVLHVIPPAPRNHFLEFLICFFIAFCIVTFFINLFV